MFDLRLSSPLGVKREAQSTEQKEVIERSLSAQRRR